MPTTVADLSGKIIGAVLVTLWLLVAGAGWSPASPVAGKDLTVDQVVAVARHGAKVALSSEARQRSADAHALLLEAAAEGVSVYWFNRGCGSGRESFIFRGDPLSPVNRKFLEDRQLQVFRRGALALIAIPLLKPDGRATFSGPDTSE